MDNLIKTLKKFPLFHICFVVTFLTTGLFVSILQVLLTFGIRSWSPSLYTHINYYVNYMLNSQIAFLGEWWSGTRCILYSDPEHIKKYFGKEPMLLIMNHSYTVDWNIGWLFCDRIGMLGQAKVFMKKALQFVPILGWTWKMQDIIFVERNWEKDKINLEIQLKRLANYPSPFLLTIFPEGTRYTPEKHRVSMEVAKSKNMPLLKHLLIPRSRGFVATINHLRSTIPAVYDVTLALNPKLGANNAPNLSSMLNGKSIVGHFLVRRISMEEIPQDEAKAAEWLQELFRHKDKCLDNFFKSGKFNPKGDMKEYKKFEYVELPRRIYSLINTIIFTSLIILPLLYVIGLLLLSGGIIQRSVALVVIAAAYVGFQKMMNLTRMDKVSNYGKTQ